MAQMYPKEIPEEILKQPYRMSEIKFFNACKKLPNSWKVLYGVTYYVKNHNHWIEGEADFVILSPEIGLLVVEIKGGRIGRDTDGWYSIDRNNEQHTIHDPVKQASNCLHNIVGYIKNQLNFDDVSFIPSRHMICFPDMSKKDMPKLIDCPKEMQILYEDLTTLESKISNFCKRNYDFKSSFPLTNVVCDKIVKLLKPSFQVLTRLSSQINHQKDIIDNLTEEQSYIWDVMGDNKRIKLSGPAGSGKTILALKFAINKLNLGGKLLIIVPTKNLKLYYNEFLYYNYKDKYDIITFPEIKTFFSNNYDAIIIDESQELTDSLWLDAYNNFHIENIEYLLCVFDSNQRLNRNSVDCPLENLVSVKLTKVVRNTKEIANFSRNFYSDPNNFKAVGPDGIKIQKTICNDLKSLTDTVQNIIKHYITDEGFNYSDIVVLLGKKARTIFAEESRQNNKYGFEFRKSCSIEGSMYKHPFVLAETIYSFRGLEANIVILCDIDNEGEFLELQNECYVGVSRAKHILHIVASEDTFNKILKNKV